MRNLRSAVLISLGFTLLGAAAIPFTNLSPARVQRMPATTAVRIGKKIVTVGQLRGNHGARVRFAAKASANGAVVAHTLLNGPRRTPPTPAPGFKVSVGHGVTPVNLIPATPKPGINLGNLGGALARVGVLEPASAYNGVPPSLNPPDMRAFCSQAWASACLYLPPGQTWLYVTAGIAGSGPPVVFDYDALLDASTCGAEGGLSQQGLPCLFMYPAAYQARFHPAANYSGSVSAQCDRSIWDYYVDFHQSLITVTIKPSLMGGYDPYNAPYYSPGPDFTSGDTPWCVIHVYPGH